MIPGVDVYSGYGLIDWRAVYYSGRRFAFIKMGEGNEPRKNDVLFRTNVDEARAAGLYVGGYLFPYPLPSGFGAPAGRTPEQQAARAWSLAAGLGTNPGELPLVVDAEWPEVGDWGKWGCTAASINLWLRQFCEAVTRLWGRKPILYTYPFWWRVIASATDVSWAADYPLWIANYTHSGEGMPPDGAAPVVPGPWDDWAFWQHSAKGSLVRVPGISSCPVDRNVFNGSLDDLRKLAGIDPDADTDPEIRLDLEDEPPEAA